MLRVLLALTFTPSLLSAQVDLPVFGNQHVINGYTKDLAGEVIPYFSVYPEYATDALLTRCTDGKKAIAWETASVPNYLQRENIPYYYFSWIAAHSSGTSSGDRLFDLFINDSLALTFTTHHTAMPSSWSASAADSTKLVFEFVKTDRHGDAHGFAHLRVPRKYITPGKPLRLKVVGRAQQSPDWYMTFRYGFEEKVEVEALPFLLKDPIKPQRPVLFTVMHFGAPEPMTFELQGGKSQRAIVRNGMQTFEFPIHAKQLGPTRINVRTGRRMMLDTTLSIQPIVSRDVYLVHHSHNDIGYSALQNEVEQIQNKNIYDALDLIDRTNDYPPHSRFKWNIESLWAVENFLGQCSEQDKQRFIAAVKNGSIALSANYANVLTGLCTPEEMDWVVEYADSLRKWYDLPINTAMQTDIPGMSWSMVDAYAANGIRYLSQGPNYIPGLPGGGDRIGSTLREQGDKPYWWKGTTGRDSILVWTAGLGYSSWHGFTSGAIRERGTRKIAASMDSLTARGYPYSMVQWRYNIVSDNGPVDSTISDFVRDWNERYSSPHLILANVNDMMQRFEEKYGMKIPTWSGDFTPYWADGAYSTAKEEGEVRMLSARLSNLIDAAKVLKKPIDPHLLYRAQRSIVMWHEHTWGAWNSISDPDDPEVIAQWTYKKAFADSAEWYVEAIEVKLGKAATPPKEGDETTIVDPIVPNYKTDRGSWRSLNGLSSDPATWKMKGALAEWWARRGTNSVQYHRPNLMENHPNARFSRCSTLDMEGTDSVVTCQQLIPSRTTHITTTIYKRKIRDKESLHLAFPFNIPNATVRIGISDTCVTPESGRIPGSNNDFFCVQRWIDVSNDSMGVTVVCPQGALWEVGEMVDERKTVPGSGKDPQHYKAWKSEAHSSSTIYLYALNNYWHTNFKADQEGPVTFDIYLRKHGPFNLEEARRFGLEMTRPLITWRR